jgi:uncharacterized integral membrane protein
MMAFLRYFILAVIAIGLLTVALANRAAVTLQLLPVDVANLVGWNWSVDLPLFLVILGGVAVGVLIGFIWEWLREHKHRAAAARRTREVEDLRREAGKPGSPPNPKRDEVVALVDGPRKAG